MNTTHCQNIESAWDNLLEALAEARQDAGSNAPVLVDLCARLDTLYATLRGLGNAWGPIRDLFPCEPVAAPETSDAPGTLPESAYWRPLAECLLKLGGSAPASRVIQAVGEHLKSKLTAVDKEPLPTTGQVRWIVKVRFSRLRHRLFGLIRADSTSGVWELTEAWSRWAADPEMPDFPKRPIPQDNSEQLVLF